MILKISDSQMLALWREGAGLEPASSEASIERFDSVNIDSRLIRAMRAWYIDYLINADVDMVPVSDLTTYARVSAGAKNGFWNVALLCPTARIMAMRLHNAECAIYDRAECPPAMNNKFVRCGRRPFVWYTPGTNDATLFTGDATTPVITSVSGVEISDDDIYTVDERVLVEIPALAQKTLTML